MANVRAAPLLGSCTGSYFWGACICLLLRLWATGSESVSSLAEGLSPVTGESGISCIGTLHICEHGDRGIYLEFTLERLDWNLETWALEGLLWEHCMDISMGLCLRFWIYIGLELGFGSMELCSVVVSHISSESGESQRGA